MRIIKGKEKNTRIGTTRTVTDTAELASLMLKGGLNCWKQKSTRAMML
jgi:hypothetical protein